jgi:FMN-dependent NADH-azoreductase
LICWCIGLHAGGSYKRLVTGKPPLAVCACRSAYGPGSGADDWDQQGRYLEHIFGFIGFTDILKILVEPTEAKPTC